MVIFITIVLVLEKRRHRLGTELVSPNTPHKEINYEQHELTEL
jgi:hypothetical protein